MQTAIVMDIPQPKKMMKRIPQKAPQLLHKQINEDYAFVVNCAFPNSFRLLNKAQYDILKAIDGQSDVSIIASLFSLSEDALVAYLNLLSCTEIIRFDESFSQPQKPDKPQSLNFWIHTTDTCNLGCSYCYISTLNTSKGMTDAVREQLIYKLVETVKRRKLKSIKFRLAGGEPLSQFKSWKQFIPYAKQALLEVGCGLEVSFITNLTLLSDDIVKFSKEYSLSFGVSLDGVDDTHDMTRRYLSGKGSFIVVDSNLRKLLSQKIPVSVNTVINNQNLAGLPELTSYLIALDVPFRYSIVKGEDIDAIQLEKYLNTSFAIMQEAIQVGWSFSKRFQFCDLKPNDLGFQTCASGFSGGAIYVDGTLKYCHVEFGQETPSSFTIFDEQKDLVEMIELGKHDEDKKSEDCKKCRYKHICTSGCPVYRKEDKDPQCSLYHQFIPLYIELQALERLKLLQDHQHAIVN